MTDTDRDELAEELFAIVKCTRHEDDALEFLTNNYDALLAALRQPAPASDDKAEVADREGLAVEIEAALNDLPTHGGRKSYINSNLNSGAIAKHIADSLSRSAIDRIDTALSKPEAVAAERERWQREGKDAVCQWLRDFQVRKPTPPHADIAAMLADSFEQSEVPGAALRSADQ